MCEIRQNQPDCRHPDPPLTHFSHSPCSSYLIFMLQTTQPNLVQHCAYSNSQWVLKSDETVYTTAFIQYLPFFPLPWQPPPPPQLFLPPPFIQHVLLQHKAHHTWHRKVVPQAAREDTRPSERGHVDYFIVIQNWNPMSASLNHFISIWHAWVIKKEKDSLFFHFFASPSGQLLVWSVLFCAFAVTLVLSCSANENFNITHTHSHTDTQSRAAISLTHSDRHTRWTPHACAAHSCKQTQTRLRFHK